MHRRREPTARWRPRRAQPPPARGRRPRGWPGPRVRRPRGWPGPRGRRPRGWPGPRVRRPRGWPVSPARRLRLGRCLRRSGLRLGGLRGGRRRGNCLRMGPLGGGRLGSLGGGRRRGNRLGMGPFGRWRDRLGMGPFGRWRYRLGMRCLGRRGCGLGGLTGLGLLASLLLGLLAGLFLGLAASLFLGLAAGAFLGLQPLALEPGPLLLLAEDVVALGDDVADGAGDGRARPDRVVVAGDHVVDALGVAVGVDETDDRDPQALGLADRDRLDLEIDHEHGVRDALHVLDSAQVGAELRQVGKGGHPLAGRQQLQLPLGLVTLEVVEALDPQRDGLEVGQQPAEPAVVDVGHVGGAGRVLDRVASLLLGAHEQHGAAAAGDLGGEITRAVQQRVGLQQVDDVDAVSLTEDEPAHLGVPTACLVAEMYAGLQQLFDADIGHWSCSLVK